MKGRQGRHATGRRVRPIVAAVVVLSTAAWAADARAVRRLFEPTDLEIEEAGVAELDLQVGAIRGTSPWRLSVPDFELDLGLWRDFELDIDGALSWQGPDDGSFRPRHLDDDNLWVALKTSLLSFDLDDPSGDVARRQGVGLGLQIGPKCPTARGARGWGVETLILLAWHTPRLELVLNTGLLLDPADGDSPRPFGLEGGLDANVQIDRAGHFALVGEIGGVRFLSSDPHQLALTAGWAWSPREDLEVSVVGLAGILEGSDRFGVLFGLSPKLAFAQKKGP